MQLTAFAILLAICAVSAQNSSVPDATITTEPTRSSSSDCPVKSVFDLCLNDEQDYVRRCSERDYACLCTANKQKLTCWNNCPHDAGLLEQQGIVQTMCSMPGANVSITPWSSSAMPTSTNSIASSTIAASMTTTSATPTKAISSSSVVDIGSVFILISTAIIYILL